MKLTKKLGIVVVFAMMVNFTIMIVNAAETQTVDIAETQDDGFITEAGIGIDSSLINHLDPNMDIRSFFVFEDLEINSWELLTNATLRLTSSQTLAFDNDSSVTVYGMKQADLGGIFTDTTTLSPGEISSMPLTSASVNVNMSQFQGGATIDINVTNIVRELVSNPHWDGHGLSGAEDGDDLGFIILGAPDEGRFSYDYRGDPARSADLIIHWGHVPPRPTPGSVVNGTVRGQVIWEDDGYSLNRTGAGADLVWNTVNMTELTEQDSGADLTLQNDTHVTFTSLTKSTITSMYRDNGAANISTFFARFYINTTAVTNSIAGPEPVTSLIGLSTVEPNVGNGLSYGGVGGDWIGLTVILNADDQRWRVWVHDRGGAVDALGGNSIDFWEDWPDLLYFEILINQTAGFVIYSIYNDASYTDLNQTLDYAIVHAAGPYRYAQLIASVGQAGGGTHTGEYYTFLENPLPDNSTWTVTDENGTVRCTALDTYQDALECIEDALGPDPTDPDPAGQGWSDSGPFTRFNMRFYILALGMGFFWGPLMVFAYERPSGYAFVIGAFIMLVGIAFMIAAGSV